MFEVFFFYLDLANVNMENSTVISSSKNAQVEVFPDVTAISHSTSQGDITRKKIKPGKSLITCRMEMYFNVFK